MPSAISKVPSVLWVRNSRLTVMSSSSEIPFSGMDNCNILKLSVYFFSMFLTFELSRGKTNNVVSEQVRHKPVCAVT